LVLKILKVILLVTTSLLGVYGTTHDFRKRGKLTRSGLLAVIGLIFSAIVAVALQFVEFNKEEQAANVAKTELDASTARQNATLQRTDQANKTLERVLQDIDRGLRPITTAAVTFVLDLPTNTPRMAQYRDRVKHAVDQESSAKLVLFPQQSNRLGPRHEEEFASAVFGPIELHFEFYRKPVDPALHAGSDIQLAQAANAIIQNPPDLTFSVFTAALPESIPNHEIEYDTESGLFAVEGDNVEADRKSWRTTGSLLAIPDLEGAQLFITLHSFAELRDDSDAERELEGIQKNADIKRDVVLHLNGGRNCHITGLQRFKTANGDPMFAFVFPRGDDFNRLFQ